MIILQTERLVLRNPMLQDAADFTDLWNSPFVLRYNAMTPRSVEQTMNQFADGTENTVLLVHKSDDKVIGAIFVEEDSLRYGVRAREISYFLSEAYARQGFMQEALQEFIPHLMERENLECITARTFRPNIASRRLLNSLGFEQMGFVPRCVKGYGDVIFDDLLFSRFKDGISLRPIKTEDAENCILLLIDDQVKKTYMLPDFSSREDAHKLFARLQELSCMNDRFVRGIYFGDTLIGIINDTEINGEELELGWAIHPDYQHKGYGTKAVKQALAELFDKGFTRITAGAFSCNAASIRVMEKCGMRLTDKTEQISYRGAEHTCIFYEITKGRA